MNLHWQAMPALKLLLMLLMNFFVLAAPGHSASQLESGELAPDFQLYDQNNQLQTLEKYRGQWVILYFYPKNDTPGCTEEACNFRDDYIGIRRHQAFLLGVNIDTEGNHRRFSKKHSLPFPLLADLNGTVARQYGAAWKLGPLMLTKRHTFIINPEGRIARIYRKVNTKTHSKEIITALQELKETTATVNP
ncbi:MAG: peroxiredoxin [Gammaproteobacteria bacterium]